MTKTFWMTLVTLLGLTVAMGGQTKQEKARAKFDQITHRDQAREQERDRDRDGDRDRDHDRAGRRDRDDDHDRDHHGFKNSHGRPPGWEHGKKTGWGDCDLPPGQAKKYGCHPPHSHHHHTREVRTSDTKPVVLPRPHAEVHAHAGVDAGVR